MSDQIYFTTSEALGLPPLPKIVVAEPDTTKSEFVVLQQSQSTGTQSSAGDDGSEHAHIVIAGPNERLKAATLKRIADCYTANVRTFFTTLDASERGQFAAMTGVAELTPRGSNTRSNKRERWKPKPLQLSSMRTTAPSAADGRAPTIDYSSCDVAIILLDAGGKGEARHKRRQIDNRNGDNHFDSLEDQLSVEEEDRGSGSMGS